MRALRTMLLLVAAVTVAMPTIARAETLKRHKTVKVAAASAFSAQVTPAVSVAKERICAQVCPRSGACLVYADK